MFSVFDGFSEETVAFLWGIRFNNRRDWFEAHKEEYLRTLYQPLRQLGEQVHGAMHEKYPRQQLNLHVCRIYRDARRLHGRGPYKDHLWFTLRQEEEQWSCAPVFWYEIGPDGYNYGLGCYSGSPLLMERFRKTMDADPAPMERLTRRLQGQARFSLTGEDYARPRPSSRALLAPWYQKKNFALEACRPHDALEFGPGLAEELLDGFCWLMPYYKYFDRLRRQAP